MKRDLPRPVTTADVYLNDIATSLRELLSRTEPPASPDGLTDVKEPSAGGKS
jgi:hypothetical protein